MKCRSHVLASSEVGRLDLYSYRLLLKVYQHPTFWLSQRACPIATMALDSEKHVAPPASTNSDSDVEILPGSINEKKLLRKLDLRLLPAVSILYLLSFLDRSNGMNLPDILRSPIINFNSRKRSYRGVDDRPEDDRQSISHWSDALLPGLRSVRTPVQYYT
jgi:hypothetical protein